MNGGQLGSQVSASPGDAQASGDLGQFPGPRLPLSARPAAGDLGRGYAGRRMDRGSIRP